jgi:hypothetical protein
MSTSVVTTSEPKIDLQVEGAPVRMSYEEYLAWEHKGGLTEWVNGEVIIHITRLCCPISG